MYLLLTYDITVILNYFETGHYKKLFKKVLHFKLKSIDSKIT